ncbi:MAG: glycerol-3-phosphate acyltransferase PlsX [Myxococcota bacterium]|jgi:glycerol-3-phosphate acyltransferase PlsX
MIRIALDAMGGDKGVEATVGGAAKLSLEEVDIRVLLVGDVQSMSEMLDGVRYDPTRIELVGADGFVSMDEKPGPTLAERPNCSLLTAARLVRAGDADALVTSGNTGAAILAAAQTFERLPGVRRAALASVYPTAKRRGPRRDPFAMMLDVGAGMGATAGDLVTFAYMGAAYSSLISEIESPRVALLSNGTEALKGTPAIVEAHRRLLETSLNFAGNVEGLDIPKGTVDVVLCDGFLGNVVLKMLEGVSDVVTGLAKEASSRRLQWRLGLSMLGGGIKHLQRMTDWKSYGGAPLLGLDSVVIKAHGRSEARAIRNAIKVAAKASRGDLVGRIRDGVASAGEGVR